MPDPADDSVDRGPGRAQRLVVVAVLVALLAAGLGQVEAWPLTGWRLFSSTRTAEQERWRFETAGADGRTQPLSLQELPVGDRLATWRLRGVEDGDLRRGAEVCRSLAVPIARARPGTARLLVLRDRQRMVRRHRWVVEHDTTLVVSCAVPGAS